MVPDGPPALFDLHRSSRLRRSATSVMWARRSLYACSRRPGESRFASVTASLGVRIVVASAAALHVCCSSTGSSLLRASIQALAWSLSGWPSPSAVMLTRSGISRPVSLISLRSASLVSFVNVLMSLSLVKVSRASLSVVPMSSACV